MINSYCQRSLIFILIFAFYSPKLFSQEHIVTLNPHGEIEIIGRNFYIEKVIDERGDKTTIGSVDVGIFNKSVNAIFSDSLSSVFLEYYNVIAPKREEMSPIIMRVKEFKISEYRTMIEYGKVVFRAQLFTKEENNYRLVLDTICIKEESTAGDITSSHPSHIRSVLNRVLIAFNKQLLNPNPPIIQNLDSLKENPLSNSKKNEPKLSDSNKLNYVFSCSYLPGINANAFRYNFYWIPFKSPKRWSFSLLLGGEITRIHDDYMVQSAYSSFKSTVFNLGIATFYKINDYFLLGLNSHFPIGNEKLTTVYGNSTSNTIVGFSPSQMIYVKSKSKLGIIAGIGIFEKVSTSLLYKQDLGARFELGIKF